MILVLLGTQNQSFSRLIDEATKLYKFDNEIYVQAGNTEYESEILNIFSFMENTKLNELYLRADVIITHAGAGSMIQAIKNNKKTIVCPRLTKYGEHLNDHQIELANKFNERNYVEVLNDGDDIALIYNKALSSKYNSWSEKSNIKDLILDFIERS